MTALQVIRLLAQGGWVEKNQKGSHKQFVHPTKKGKITVPIMQEIYQLEHSEQF